MARPLRLHVPGGFYHVTLRGNHRQEIFRTPDDRDLLDGMVADAIQEFSARIHAYCWVSNHIHMLVQVSGVPLGKIVLRVASRYARRFQWRLGTTGHLFERRYHAFLVDAEAYLLTLVRYIHLNPKRAGLVADPAQYPWSSHRRYIGLGGVGLVSTGFMLGMLSADPQQAMRSYFEWMNAADETRSGQGVLTTHVANPQVMGDDAFLQRVSPVQAGKQAKPTLEDLLAECSRRHKLTPDAVLSRSRARQFSAARAWLSRQAVSRGVATTSAVARLLNCSEAAVRGLLTRYSATLLEQ